MIRGALNRFRNGLRKTREGVVGRLQSLFGGRVRLVEGVLVQIEELGTAVNSSSAEALINLLNKSADVGIRAVVSTQLERLIVPIWRRHRRGRHGAGRHITPERTLTGFAEDD